MMSDSGFTKTFKKQSARAKEKLLESLGKAERTRDEVFEDHSTNFDKQYNDADRLQRQIKNYVACVRAMAQATKGFHEVLREVYESDWPATEHVHAMSQSIELLWDDYHEKLLTQALNPLMSYHSQFGDLKAKIGKRSRKMIDYDGARHNLEATKAANKKDQAKQQKAQEQFSVAEKLYADLNTELLDELPAVYDSRITFYVNNFQTICNLEQTFHSETSKLNRDLCKVMDELGHSIDRLRVPRRSIDITPAKTASVPPPRPSPITKMPNQQNQTKSVTDSPKQNTHNDIVSDSSTKEVAIYPKVPEENGESEQKIDEISQNPFDSEGSSSERRLSNASAKEEIVKDEIEQKPESVKETESVGNSTETEPEKKLEPEVNHCTPSAEESPKDSPKLEEKNEQTKEPNKETDKGHNVLYKVRATHRYSAEDADELTFEAGELIMVIPYEDPDDQDEGWHTGIKESSGEKGVFPANFTKPL